MPFRLRDNLHWCNCLGRAVFLDTAADRYFCLPPALNESFVRLAEGDLQVDSLGSYRKLRELRILIDDPRAPASLAPASVDSVTGDYPINPRRRLPMLRIVAPLMSQVHIGWSLRRRGFQQSIDAAARQRPGLRLKSTAPRALETIVAGAASTALFMRAHDRCLVRALAVHRACKRRGIRVKLVFGVIASPFAAHCWVQFGSTVLVGGFEQARLYTPILVVE